MSVIRLKETLIVYSESLVKQKTVIILFQATVMTKKYASGPLMSLRGVLFCVFLNMTLKKKLKYRKSLELIFKL